MNVQEHKTCFGTIFPEHLGGGDQAGKVFSLQTDVPRGLMRAKPHVRENIGQWDDCRRCPEFQSCYQLSMARIALETAVSTKF